MRVTALCALVLGSLLSTHLAWGADVALTMPNARGRRGLEVTVALEANDLSGANVTAAEFVLRYNPAHVTPIGIEQAGSLTEGWLGASRDFGGGFKVALASATPAAGAGTLVHLRLLIGLGAPDTIPLTVSDAYLNTDPVVVATGRIAVDEAPESNGPPVAMAGRDFAVQVTEPFTLSAAGSTDADGAITGYEWDLGDGNRSSGPATLHVYDWVGSYTITLRVGDDAGAVAMDTAVVTVTPAEATLASPTGEARALVAGGGVVLTAPASVFRDGALVASAHRADAESLASAATPDGFDIPLPALTRRVELTRDGSPVATVREELVIELSFTPLDLIRPDGSSVDPGLLAAFVVRKDGTVGMLREVARTDTSVTFATPRLGVLGLGVAAPGVDLPDAETVAPSEDVNADGLVNIIDLVTVAQAFGRAGAPAGSADINGDGVVNIFDLVTVASHFGQATGAPSRHARVGERPTITVVPAHSHGDVVTFEIRADTLAGVAGYELSFTVDPSLAELVDIEQGDALGPRAFWIEPTVSAREHRVASVRLGPAESSGVATLARIELRDVRRRRSTAIGSAIQIRQILLSDVVGQAMTHRLVRGRANWPEAKTTVYANYPNPFNPETWIPFSLAETSDVTVRVYDAGGGLVRTLSLGERNAGAHTAPSMAAYWDGRNETGEDMASGVYYYEIAAGSVRTTRRMLMVK
jgi:PKD repeat protein